MIELYLLGIWVGVMNRANLITWCNTSTATWQISTFSPGGNNVVIDWVSTLDVSPLEASPGEDFSFVIHSISKPNSPSCPVKMIFWIWVLTFKKQLQILFLEEKKHGLKKNGKKRFLAPSINLFKAQFSARFCRPQDSQEELSAKSQQQDQQCCNPQQDATG